MNYEDQYTKHTCLKLPIGVTKFAKDINLLGHSRGSIQTGFEILLSLKSKENGLNRTIYRILSYMNTLGVSCTQENLLNLND